MGKGIALALLLALGACSSFSAGKTAVAVKGAEVADELLLTAEWTLCYAATVGSIKRRYGMTVEQANLYRQFCYGEAEANIIGPLP